MQTYTYKKQENKKQPLANSFTKKQNNHKPSSGFVDQRTQAIAQRRLQDIANRNSSQKTIQKKENKTGLPDQLKTGVENLSGYSMDDVKVHYNSSKPAQLNAHAYAQGANIHLAAGQEGRAWHVVQQKQGRVKPTMQLNGKVNVNDDARLEKEADVMGQKSIGQGNMLNLGNKYKPSIIARKVSQLDGSLLEKKHLPGIIQKWPEPQVNVKPDFTDIFQANYVCHDAVMFWVLLNLGYTIEDATKIIKLMHNVWGEAGSYVHEALGYDYGEEAHEGKKLSPGDIVFTKGAQHSMVVLNRNRMTGFNNYGTVGDKGRAKAEYIYSIEDISDDILKAKDFQKVEIGTAELHLAYFYGKTIDENEKGTKYEHPSSGLSIGDIKESKKAKKQRIKEHAKWEGTRKQREQEALKKFNIDVAKEKK